jgi:hypothetical protein
VCRRISGRRGGEVGGVCGRRGRIIGLGMFFFAAPLGGRPILRFLVVVGLGGMGADGNFIRRRRGKVAGGITGDVEGMGEVIVFVIGVLERLIGGVRGSLGGVEGGGGEIVGVSGIIVAGTGVGKRILGVVSGWSVLKDLCRVSVGRFW